MSTPHWSYRLSQHSKTTPSNNKSMSAGKRIAQTDAALESIIRNTKAGPAAQSNRSKKSVISRPFTTPGGQYRKKTETTRTLVKSGQANEPILASRGMREFSADLKGKVRFHEADHACADSKVIPKSAGKQSIILTEAILQRHNEYLKRHGHVSMMDRVSSWVKSVPLFLDDPETAVRSELSFPPNMATFARPRTTSPGRRHSSAMNLYNLDGATSRVECSQSQLQQRSLPLLVDTNVSPLFVSSWSSNEKQSFARRMKELHKSALPDTRKSIDVERGKLLCCLKVEIKTGVYQMLPVHQNDDPAVLSTSFCKTHRLAGSIESLKMHIHSSIKTYGKQ